MNHTDENDRGISFKSLDDFEEFLTSLTEDAECITALAELDITLARLQGQLDEAEHLTKTGEFVNPDWLKKASYCSKMHKSYRGQLQDHRGQLRRNREEQMYNDRRRFEARFEKTFINILKPLIEPTVWKQAHAEALAEAKSDASQ